jgi:hypothetical protein
MAVKLAIAFFTRLLVVLLRAFLAAVFFVDLVVMIVVLGDVDERWFLNTSNNLSANCHARLDGPPCRSLLSYLPVV